MIDPLARSAAILSWMVLPVVGGFLYWCAVLRARPDGHETASRIARACSRCSVMGVIPPMLILVFWTASLPSGPTLALPFLGLAVHLLGGFAGWGLARMLDGDRRLSGACFLGGASSNVLTFGGIVVVLLLSTPEDPHGEQALGAMQLYRLLEAPFYYLLAWPFAGMLSASSREAGDWRSALGRSFRPEALLPIFAMGVGLALNLAEVARPRSLDGAAAWLVRLNVTLLGVAVGLSLRRAAVRKWAACCAGIGAIKFGLLPLAAVGGCWALGFRGLPLQTAAVCASMPVAFMAVVGGQLLGLDEEVLGSLWISTTGAMVLVVPLLAWALPILGSV